MRWHPSRAVYDINERLDGLSAIDHLQACNFEAVRMGVEFVAEARNSIVEQEEGTGGIFRRFNYLFVGPGIAYEIPDIKRE